MFELEVVLHTDFGGFSFNEEMATWLQENRNWTILNDEDYDYSKKDYPLTTLVKQSFEYLYSPHSSDIKLRSHQDLIDCVRALKEQHKNDTYPDKHYGYIHKLKITSVRLVLEIEDYYDGKERLNSYVVED